MTLFSNTLLRQFRQVTSLTSIKGRNNFGLDFYVQIGRMPDVP